VVVLEPTLLTLTFDIMFLSLLSYVLTFLFNMYRLLFTVILSRLTSCNQVADCQPLLKSYSINLIDPKQARSQKLNKEEATPPITSPLPLSSPLSLSLRSLPLARLANTLLKDEESARDNHVLACNFAKYSPIKNFFSLADSAVNLS